MSRGYASKKQAATLYRTTDSLCPNAAASRCPGRIEEMAACFIVHDAGGRQVRV